ncbi:MAG: YiiX/YebB-like N1pC/P60 family cysteine hydrolase [Candidatus Binatia bacterium]
MRPFAKISDWFTDFVVRLLVKERRTYHQRFPNDVARLRETLRPGDVVLVDGSQRISEVIKYLTQSSWSHAAVYVGDSLIRRGDHQASIWTQRYGTAADALLVEANVEDGVTASPLSKYVNHNLRICRPINLRPGDLSTVLDTVISQIGSPYNRDHIQSLLWYFLPVEIMPKRWQRRALETSGRLSKEMVCSTQIAMAFQKVRYPIQPLITVADATVPEPGGGRARRRIPEWLSVGRRRTRRTVFDTGVFVPCDPSFVTPRDFDLSPYFEIVKIAADNPREFDYKKIHWSSPTPTMAASGNGRPAAEPTTRRTDPRVGPAPIHKPS